MPHTAAATEHRIAQGIIFMVPPCEERDSAPARLSIGALRHAREKGKPASQAQRLFRQSVY
jgi:hypothetical protein